MYVCNECGAKFDEPIIESELIGEYWGTPAYRDIECCPNCRLTDIEEMEEEDE